MITVLTSKSHHYCGLYYQAQHLNVQAKHTVFLTRDDLPLLTYETSGSCIGLVWLTLGIKVKSSLSLQAVFLICTKDETIPSVDFIVSSPDIGYCDCCEGEESVELILLWDCNGTLM